MLCVCTVLQLFKDSYPFCSILSATVHRNNGHRNHRARRLPNIVNIVSRNGLEKKAHNQIQMIFFSAFSLADQWK